MKRSQIENLYKVNGLDDYKLRNIEDLLKVHGIDCRAVDGYSRLDDLNRAIYEKFIINFFNGLGLESRAALVPKVVYYAEQTDLLVKEDPEDDYFVVAGGIVKAIDKNGMKSVIRSWRDEDYKDFEPVESESTTYLRFEYEHRSYDDGTPRKEWLHVIKEGTQWY